MEINEYFPISYEASRDRFRGQMERVRQYWTAARLDSFRIPGDEDLTIDWICAEPTGIKEKLLVFSTGEHGLEGFVGSAALQLFLDEFLPNLDPSTTGVLLIHAINPWGMKHRRRVNRQNVDLNRNFGWEPGAFNLSVNPDYDTLDSLINPRGALKNYAGSKRIFTWHLLRRLLRLGIKRFARAVLFGQYRFPRGIYFGGSELQEETRATTELYNAWMPAYRQIVHLDIHTGYGPSQPMTVVNSWMEPTSSRDMGKKFGYPNIVKSNPQEFYSIQGDMIDYVYSLARREFPANHLYATSFEFGTFGHRIMDQVRGLRAMVLENQVYWYGAGDQAIQMAVEQELMEMFYPSSPIWRARALQDAREAMSGIFGCYQYLK